MTDREKAIVMAYTGVCMLSGNKFQIFHKYIEEIMGRPVYTHEMAIKAVDDEIKSRSKADFIALCAEQEPKNTKLDQRESEMSDYILELEEACNTLKKHCEQEKCKKCIFHSGKLPYCSLMNTPEAWSIDKIFNKEE